MKRWTFILFILLAFSCTKKSLDPTGYVSWVENKDNGLFAEKTIGEFRFQLQYKPVEYIILRENNGHVPADSAIARRKKELGEMQYYNLRIIPIQGKSLLQAGISDESEYYSRLEYFVSVMQDDLSLVQGADTLGCLLYHFERNYDLTPYADFVIGFEAPQSGTNSDRILIYEDRVLGVGPVRLPVSHDAIASTPHLLTAQ